MPRGTVLAREKTERVPWFVRLRLSPAEVRWRSDKRPTHFTFIKQKEWNDFLERRRRGQLRVDRGANTTLQCPGRGRFLRHFYITSDPSTLERAKTDRWVHRLISGYICWLPCSRTYFLDDITERGVEPLTSKKRGVLGK